MDQTRLQQHVLKIFDSGVLEPFPCSNDPLFNNQFFNQKSNNIIQGMPSSSIKNHIYKICHIKKPVHQGKNTFTFKQPLSSILKASVRNKSADAVISMEPIVDKKNSINLPISCRTDLKNTRKQ